ncbi:uncharacterized protein At2g39920 isoform X2 [Physcomitrium patens]|uniref:uncharacterized protein At2g39920 isoform X2 n=1 Tax=Physcomitrium patens TaxID=3218 RepID=UPI000D17C253|nr:acid phosphatase 1-like isoform X2 [Physcomitrium patens]|eukprot:XP_024397871.1 acid phosphatase 1-like isoform X2 [Physcomitrella patens]
MAEVEASLLVSLEKENGENEKLGSTTVSRLLSQGLDAENDLVRRESFNFLFGSLRQSTDSLLGSRLGSELFGSRYGFGNTYVLIDDMGIYFSSHAVTFVILALAVVGIVLFTLMVTLSTTLGQCQGKSIVILKPDVCASFARNAEVNNLQNWTLPQDCVTFSALYFDSGQYHADCAHAIDAARTYLASVVVESDGQDMVVLELDDTMLSSISLYTQHHFKALPFKLETWNNHVSLTVMPPLGPMASLYRELKVLNWSLAIISERFEAQRNDTVKNLSNAGYEGYTLILSFFLFVYQPGQSLGH